MFQLEGASLQRNKVTLRLWLRTQWRDSVSSSSHIQEEPRTLKRTKKTPKTFWPAGPPLLLLSIHPLPLFLLLFLPFIFPLISNYSSSSFPLLPYSLPFLLAPPLSSLIYNCSSSLLLQSMLLLFFLNITPSPPSHPPLPTASLPHHNHSSVSSNSFSSLL